MGQVALVTGGAVRVGRAISVGLAEAGFDVVIHYNRSSTAARAVAQDVEGLGRRAILVEGDLSRSDAVEDLAKTVSAEFGRLDLVVNNASLFRAVPFLEIDEEEWDRVMSVNLKAPFLIVRGLAPLLQASCGSVVNVVDLSALRPFPSYPHHSVSKAGLLQLTRVMARALAPEVRVNAIAPGMVLPPPDMTEGEVERERGKTLLKRAGSPQDVVRTVLFLAESPFLTGEVIIVDGGRHLAT